MKDLGAREILTGNVPSAGVGTAFSREAAARAAAGTAELFSPSSFTEDYDLAFRLRRLGVSQVFVRLAVERRAAPRAFVPTLRPRQRDYVAVREFFPQSVRAAVRQKSRWVIGIVFQGWRRLGWEGGVATKYALARDRKVLLTSVVAIAAYGLVANVLLLALAARIWPGVLQHVPEPGPVLPVLLVANLALLGNRILQRAGCVLVARQML